MTPLDMWPVSVPIVAQNAAAMWTPINIAKTGVNPSNTAEKTRTRITPTSAASIITPWMLPKFSCPYHSISMAGTNIHGVPKQKPPTMTPILTSAALCGANASRAKTMHMTQVKTVKRVLREMRRETTSEKHPINSLDSELPVANSATACWVSQPTPTASDDTWLEMAMPPPHSNPSMEKTDQYRNWAKAELTGAERLISVRIKFVSSASTLSSSAGDSVRGAWRLTSPRASSRESRTHRPMTEKLKPTRTHSGIQTIETY
mmetsp:Transcript_16773/g.45420  ORF Transcript_16773/g.45420 Transcript_16773/m.45420 type:complete len:261 (+) Transcript_16773:280-1062(+)